MSMKEMSLCKVCCATTEMTPKTDERGVAFSLRSRDYKDMQIVAIENHPADSRVKISDDGIVQTLSSRMGTGGGQRADGYGRRKHGRIEIHSQKAYSS